MLHVFKVILPCKFCEPAVFVMQNMFSFKNETVKKHTILCILKSDHRETECEEVEWIQLAQDMGQW
jgi:hypothetical protein